MFKLIILLNELQTEIGNLMQYAEKDVEKVGGECDCPEHRNLI